MTGSKEAIDNFCKYKQKEIVMDKDGNRVFLAATPYVLRMSRENNPDVTFHENSEFKLEAKD
jgi:peptide subunit release factor RF-3